MGKWGKWFWRSVLLLGAVLSYFEIIPTTWRSTVDLLTDIELFALNNAAYPVVFSFFVGLAVATIFVPEVVGLIRRARKYKQPALKNMTAWAAVDYIIEESEFGKNLPVTMKEFRGCEEFSRAAEHGDLEVEGRPQHHANTEDIVTSYWRVGHLAFLKYAKHLCGEDQSDGGETEQKRTDIVSSTFTVYVGLRVHKEEVKRIWHAEHSSA